MYLAARNGRHGVSVSLCARRLGYDDVCTSFVKIGVGRAKGGADLFGNHIVADIAPDGSARIEVTPISTEIAL